MTDLSKDELTVLAYVKLFQDRGVGLTCIYQKLKDAGLLVGEWEPTLTPAGRRALEKTNDD